MLLQIDVQPHSAIASFLSNEQKEDQNPLPPPAPLYANLRTSSHHHHNQSSSDSHRGVLLTVGRKNCDVTFETDKCVSRSHCRLRLISLHAKNEEEEEEQDGVPKACYPRNEEEKEACEGTTDGWIVVLEDLGSKFGTYILKDVPEPNNQNDKNESTKKNQNDNDNDDDETDDEEMVENSLNHPNSQSIPITMAMYQSSLLAGGNPPQPPPMDEDGVALVKQILNGKDIESKRKQAVQKVETKQSIILSSLHEQTKTSNNNNRTILLLCGQNGSILKISRIPLHFTLSRLPASTKSHLQTISPLIGATLHTTWEHLHTTHLITPSATTTAKHLTAWCAQCPIVTPDYAEALYQRINIEDDLPDCGQYKAPGDTPMDDVKIGENRGVDTMKYYTILSLTENDEMVPLVQAAGCTSIISCSSYNDTTSFSQFLGDTISESTKESKKVLFVDSKSRKCKKQRTVLYKRMEEQKDVWAVQPKDIASALSSFGKEDGGILLDVFGKEIIPLAANVEERDDEEGNGDDIEEKEDEHNVDVAAVDGDDDEEEVAIADDAVHVIENDEHDVVDENSDVNRTTTKLQTNSPKKRRLADIQEVEGEDEADDSSPEGGRQYKRIKSTSNKQRDDEKEEVPAKTSSSPTNQKKNSSRKRKMDNNEEGNEAVVENDDNATAITSSSSSMRKDRKKKKTSGWMTSTKRSNTNNDTSGHHKPSLMTIKQDDDNHYDDDGNYDAPISPTSSSYHHRPHITSSSPSPTTPKWKKILPKSKDGWYKTAPTGKIRTEQRNIAAAYWEKEMNDDSHHHISSSSNANIVKMEDAAETESRNDLIVRTDEEVRIWRHQMTQERKRKKKGGGKKDAPDYRRFRKNVVIPGNSWCFNDDEEDENDMSYDGNTSRIRLRSVLPKESERQKQLEVSQRELERERLAADVLFHDGNGVGGGRGGRGRGGNIRDFFRMQQKVKRSGGGSSVASGRSRGGRSRR